MAVFDYLPFRQVDKNNNFISRVEADTADISSLNWNLNKVKIIDKDNDILWQGGQKVPVGGQNGARFSVQLGVGTCLAPNKVQITLER